MKKNADGYRASSLERHGAYEVRLIDQPGMARNDTAPFWLELFDHATKRTLDSYGSYDLEASAIAADAFIAQAQFLQQTQARTCKLERPDSRLRAHKSGRPTSSRSKTALKRRDDMGDLRRVG